MVKQQMFLPSFLFLVIVSHIRCQELKQEVPQNSIVLKSLQPPPLTVPDDSMAEPSVRKKRCGGGGGGCGGGGGSKTYNVHITVTKTQSHPAPMRMQQVHRPAQVAYVPVAVVPVYTVARPAPVCCGGGGGGGGGKGKWGK